MLRGRKNRSAALLLLVSLLVQSVQRAKSQAPDDDSCSLCPDGSQIPDPSKVISVPGGPLPVESCATLIVASSFLDADSSDCQGIQLISSICDCPISENACQLCPDVALGTPKVELVDLATTVPSFPPDDVPADFIFTCELFEAALHRFDTGTSACFDAQSASTMCGCLGTAFELNITVDTMNVNETDAPSQTPKKPCTLCPLGEAVPFPEKELNFALPIPVDNCAALELATSIFDAESTDCTFSRALATFCGCEKPEGSCSICSTGTITKPQATHQWLGDLASEFVPEGFEEFASTKLSCEFFDGVLASRLDATDATCYVNQLRGGLCGCPSSEADTLVLVQRIASFLSIIGSVLILVEVFRDKSSRATTYSQIVSIISAFDLVSSIAQALATIMLPTESPNYGGTGNEITCKLQGWMIQLGYGSPVFNCILASYFYVVINRNWQEHKLLKLRAYVFGCGILATFVLAFAALRFYEPSVSRCSIYPPPLQQSWLPTIFFNTIPSSLAMVGCTSLLTLIYCHVRKHEKRSDSRSFRRREEHGNLTRKVFYQNLYFLAAFYISYPISIVTPFVKLRKENYWLFVAANFLWPLQGFLNFLAYSYRKKNIEWLANIRKSVLTYFVPLVYKCLRRNEDEKDDHESTPPMP